MQGLGVQQVILGPSSPSCAPSPLHGKLASMRRHFSLIAQGREAMGVLRRAQNEAQPWDKKAEVGKERQVLKLLEAAATAVEERDYGGIAFYCGIAAGGLFVADFTLNTLHSLPLLPQAIQTVGLAYALLLACWTLKGKRLESLPTSPLKTVIELLNSGNNQTSPLLQDLKGEIAVTMDKGNGLVNKMEVMQRINTNYAQTLAEKEALEAVAIQLAAERDEAVSQASALKQAVNSMTDRMHAFDTMLNQEIQQLKQHNLALETVALQMATERDDALKQVEELRKHVGLQSYPTGVVDVSSHVASETNAVR